MKNGKVFRNKYLVKIDYLGVNVFSQRLLGSVVPVGQKHSLGFSQAALAATVPLYL